MLISIRNLISSWSGWQSSWFAFASNSFNLDISLSKSPLNPLSTRIFALIIGYQFFSSSDLGTSKLSNNEFKEILKENDIEKILIVNDDFAHIFIKEEALTKEKHSAKTKSPLFNKKNPLYMYDFGDLQNFENDLKTEKTAYDLTFDKDNAKQTSIWDGIFMWLPFIFIIAIWIFIMRRMSGSGGGGGAGGYAGAGGAGGTLDVNGSNGTGGSGGGGSGAPGDPQGGGAGAGGGGVGILGQSAAGTGGISASRTGGTGGSGGSEGATVAGLRVPAGNGGNYGGGGGGATYGLNGLGPGGTGGSGAVRIIWGAGRVFPATNTADV